MKRLLLLSAIVIFIPIIVVSLFISVDNIKFHYVSNLNIRVKNVENNKIFSIPFEEYIKGVLAGEMPTSFNIEALKAQAVAARSYALVSIKNNKDKDYDVVNSTLNQVYLSDDELKNKWKGEYEDKIKKIKLAVESTAGEYLSYNGDVALTMFFSTSPGKTENSEDVFSEKVPYLRSVESVWDEKSPAYEDSYSFDLKDFYLKLGLDYCDKLNALVTKKSQTGRIMEIKINDNLFKGRDFASKLGLRSNYFEIKQDNLKVIINTKGFGHGVGMSQYGALGMANDGYKYDDILKYYYKGTEIKKM